MDPFGDDDIVQLLRLKRYEQPPASYYENFLSEFRRRQRDQLLRQSVLAICLERAQNFVFRLDVRSLAPYPAAIAAVLVCGAVVSIRIYQQPNTTQFAVQSSPVPTRSPNTEKGLDFAPPGLIPAFDAQPAVLPANSRDIRMLPVLPAHPLRSDEFVPLNLEWESLDDQPLLEK
jgi:hypothetical protein